MPLRYYTYTFTDAGLRWYPYGRTRFKLCVAIKDLALSKPAANKHSVPIRARPWAKTLANAISELCSCHQAKARHTTPTRRIGRSYQSARQPRRRLVILRAPSCYYYITGRVVLKRARVKEPAGNATLSVNWNGDRFVVAKIAMSWRRE